MTDRARPGLVAFLRHPTRKQNGSILTTPEPAWGKYFRSNMAATNVTSEQFQYWSVTTQCLAQINIKQKHLTTILTTEHGHLVHTTVLLQVM